MRLVLFACAHRASTAWQPPRSRAPPRTRTAIASPPGPLSEAWLAESKDGLVQMLREHRPLEQQSLAVFSMIASHAPRVAASAAWWRGDHYLISSHFAAQALREHGGGAGLRQTSTVAVRASDEGELSAALDLECGSVLRLSGALTHTTVEGNESGGIIKVVLSAAELSEPEANAAPRPYSPRALMKRLPTADAPFVVKLRPVYVDDDLLLLREMSRPKGRDPLVCVLSRRGAR